MLNWNQGLGFCFGFVDLLLGGFLNWKTDSIVSIFPFLFCFYFFRILSSMFGFESLRDFDFDTRDWPIFMFFPSMKWKQLAAGRTRHNLLRQPRRVETRFGVLVEHFGRRRKVRRKSHLTGRITGQIGCRVAQHSADVPLWSGHCHWKIHGALRHHRYQCLSRYFPAFCNVGHVSMFRNRRNTRKPDVFNFFSKLPFFWKICFNSK